MQKQHPLPFFGLENFGEQQFPASKEGFLLDLLLSDSNAIKKQLQRTKDGHRDESTAGEHRWRVVQLDPIGQSHSAIDDDRRKENQIEPPTTGGVGNRKVNGRIHKANALSTNCYGASINCLNTQPSEFGSLEAVSDPFGFAFDALVFSFFPAGSDDSIGRSVPSEVIKKDEECGYTLKGVPSADPT